VFTEVFLVQIRQKFQKIHYEVRIQAKNNSENALQRLKLGAKKKIQGGKRGVGGERIFPHDLTK
jgi:hypothetical protein